MAFDNSNNIEQNAVDLDIFNVERVQLQFSIASHLVAAQVANNVLVLALSSGRILRIDLDSPAEIDGTSSSSCIIYRLLTRNLDIDLPKKSSDNVEIRHMYLDPTASHLIICTANGENFYLHTQSKQPRPLSRLRGVQIKAIAWNPALPTTSTREILIGASDGNIYETYIETATEFYRKEEKFLKVLRKIHDGPITGLWMDVVDEIQFPDSRRVLIATESKLYHLVGKTGRLANEGGASIYTRLFDKERVVEYEVSKIPFTSNSQLVVSPDQLSSNFTSKDRIFAWLSPEGTFYGNLLRSSAKLDLGNKVFSEAKMLLRSRLPISRSVSDPNKTAQESIDSIALTQWHVIHLIGERLVCTNRLDDRVVFDQIVLDTGQKSLGLLADQKKNTFWLLTTEEIYEIVVSEEDRDIWKITLAMEDFDTALRYARTSSQKDTVATAYGDYLISKGLYNEAASTYGKSSKPFEQVTLTLIESDQHDALRKYLISKITTYKKSSVMQRIMIATWLIEIFMSKLNSLDDSNNAEDIQNSDAEKKIEYDVVTNEFRDFVTKYQSDLDKKTTYDVISSHGREKELLFFAGIVKDYNYILAYWIQRERWKEALDVLKKQKDPDIFYRYSSGLITHVGAELIDILMRHPELNPRNLIPALLSYNFDYNGPLSKNQAIRYLIHCINNLNSTDAAVHNTLISIYASHPSNDESDLLSYLNSQGEEPFFDSDFALRLCMKHSRVQSCVHIYSNMGQYLQAVNLALDHSAIDLASMIADRPISNPQLRKKLWLAVAKKVISQSNGTKTVIDFLKRCDLLQIEDLISFFPEFVVIDDFKDEICTALEEYNRSIDLLKKEMDESSQTAENIRIDIAALNRRYAIVQPGEKCYTCRLPLLSRQFFVFPCQHAFHSDCLRKKVLESASVSKSRAIRELQGLISKSLLKGAAREKAIAELDGHVAGSW